MTSNEFKSGKQLGANLVLSRREFLKASGALAALAPGAVQEMITGGHVTDQKDMIGHSYLKSLLRVEHRPKRKPHSREEILRILDTLVEGGVDAWWYSVSGKGSYPLFPSRILPYKEKVAVDYYPWITEQAHKRGIAIASWEYLSKAPLLMNQHPDWRMRFLEGEVIWKEDPALNHFACFRSPYGELLKEYTVEVIKDLGFDAVWFDGSMLYSPAVDGFLMACNCHYCSKAFKAKFGEHIPQWVDWQSPVFQKFVEWRYDFFVDYWRSLADHVRHHAPKGIVAYNFFNRVGMGAFSGIPLRHEDMDALIASEGTTLTLEMQLKEQRAFSSRHPVELWESMRDGAHLGYPVRPNPEPAGLVYYIQAAATAGGYASFGCGLPPSEYLQTFKEISRAVMPLKPYIGGEPVLCVGLVDSGYTKDYAFEKVAGDYSGYSKHMPAVNTVYGFGFLLNHLHLPFELVFDNQFNETLQRYKVIVLPDVQCMADEAAKGLTEYLQTGGTVIMTGETGVKTPTGQIRERGVLDDLAGIESRTEMKGFCFLRPASDLLNNKFPEEFQISGEGRLVKPRDVALIHAYGRIQQLKKKGASNIGLVEFDRKGVAVFERKIGEGRLIFVSADIGSDYALNASKRSRELVLCLLGDLELPFTTDAPVSVTIAPWSKENKLILHVLNKPQTMFRMQNPSDAPKGLYIEDVTPTGPIHIELRNNAKKIYAPLNRDNLEVKRNGDKTLLTLARLEQHEVIVLEH